MSKKDDKNKNPWGKPKSEGPKNKKKRDDRNHHDDGQQWAETPFGRHGNDGDDVDEMFRHVQKRFQNFMPGSKKYGFLFILFVLLGAWCLTGFYRVQPEENAVVLFFGKHTHTVTTAGLGYHLPWPIQDVKKVNVTFERRIEIGFRSEGSGRTSRFGQKEIDNSGKKTDVLNESLMVTGDENIIDIDFVVLWRISDAKNYLFEIRNPENTIKKVAESAMREVIGRTEIQLALTESRGLIEANTRELMQKMMDEYDSGIAINEVQLQKVNPPQAVVSAFDDVLRARADKDRFRNEAEAYRNKVIPEARGASERLLQQAEAYKQEVINGAEGDAERFVSVYNAYAKAKDVTKKRLYLETMQEVMKNSKKVIIDGKNGSGVLPYLPLDKLQGGRKAE